MEIDVYQRLEGSEVVKNDTSHQIAGGWFAVFNIFDSDEEIISHVDIPSYQARAIDFARNSRVCNFNHERDQPARGYLVDNIVFDTPEFARHVIHQLTGLPEASIPIIRLGHFGSFQFDDPEDFALVVENGGMFSIEGRARRHLIEEDGADES